MGYVVSVLVMVALVLAEVVWAIKREGHREVGGRTAARRLTVRCRPTSARTIEVIVVERLAMPSTDQHLRADCSAVAG
jgi:hypothetical protein